MFKNTGNQSIFPVLLVKGVLQERNWQLSNVRLRRRPENFAHRDLQGHRSPTDNKNHILLLSCGCDILVIQ